MRGVERECFESAGHFFFFFCGGCVLMRMLERTVLKE